MVVGKQYLTQSIRRNISIGVVLVGIAGFIAGCKADKYQPSSLPLRPYLDKHSIIPVAETEHSGFFSVKELSNGDIVAGTYCYPHTKQCDLIHIGKGVVGKILAGESIFSINEIDSKIYLSTENRGKIFISSLKDYDFKLNKGVFQDGLRGCFKTEKLFGKIISIGSTLGQKPFNTEIRVKGHGVVAHFNGRYIKDLILFKGKAIAPGIDHRNNTAGWAESSDGISWKWAPKRKAAEFMHAAVSPNGRVMLIGGMENGTAALFETVDGVNVRHLNTYQKFGYVTKPSWLTNVYAIIPVSRGWRSKSGGAHLFLHPGKVDLRSIPEAEITGLITVNENTLYMASRQEDGHGKVYQVNVKNFN